jgi:isopenicillin N synthase-like dioxygenase/pyrrolidone-carboxylate peptidase
MSILVTGFSSFGDVAENPSAQIVDMMANDTLSPINASVHIIDVSTWHVDNFVQQQLEPFLRESSGPVSILHMGVASEMGKEFRMERLAYNDMTFRIPDCLGYRPVGQMIDTTGPAALQSTAPLASLQFSDQVNVSISEDPGRYVCNYLYYRSLMARSALGVPGSTLFLHVPLASTYSLDIQHSFAVSLCQELICASQKHFDVKKLTVANNGCCDLALIDLADPDISDQKHATAIRQSLQDKGFFLVRPDFDWDSTVERSIKAHKAFFALPVDKKQKLKMNSSTMTGWHEHGEETLDPSKSTCGDLREGIYFRRRNDKMHPLSGDNQWPARDDLPGYRETVLSYMELLTDLGFRLLRLIALSLGLGEYTLNEYFTDPMVTLRPIHYKGMSNESNGRFACGAHADYGFLTILCADSPGLQILVGNEWLDVHPPIKEAFAVNIGDMATQLTGYRSTIHRVVNPSGGERYSIPFFFEPNFYSSIPIIGGKSTGSIISGHYLLEKYSATHKEYPPRAD